MAKRKKGPTPKKKTAADKPVTIQLPRPNVSEFVRYIVVPIFPGRPEDPPGGSPGRYVVTFILGIPGVSSVINDLHVPQLMDSGDSLLGVPGNVDRYMITVGGAPDNLPESLAILKNANGRLARIGTSVVAKSFAEAEAAAYDILMPQLSVLAFETDVPLEVKATVIIEEATSTQHIAATMMGKVRAVPAVQGYTTVELRPILASYREGLNSTSPTYQCLCFWKVLEGVKTFHMKRERAMARSGSTPPPDPLNRLVPTNEADLPDQLEWSLDRFRPYLGKAYRDVMDDSRDTIRNAVAHITPGMELLLADYFADVEKCREIIPVLRFIARDLIKNEMALASSVPSAGSPQP